MVKDYVWPPICCDNENLAVNFNVTCILQHHLNQWFSNCVTRTTSGTRAAFLPYSKSFVNSFLCYNSLVCYANVANFLFAILILSTLE